MSTVNERFKTIRKDLGFNQQKFASELGISQTHISGIENGRDNPSMSLLKLLCAKFSISEEWLIDGVGTPLPTWDITTDEGALSKYNVLRSTFEKELRNSTGESLVSMVQSFCYLAGTLNTGKLNQQDAIVYRKAICSVMDELERLTAMVSPDSLKPSKNDAMGWVSVKNSCAKSLENINQFVKSAVNIFLEKYGEEMKL